MLIPAFALCQWVSISLHALELLLAGIEESSQIVDAHAYEMLCCPLLRVSAFDSFHNHKRVSTLLHTFLCSFSEVFLQDCLMRSHKLDGANLILI